MSGFASMREKHLFFDTRFVEETNAKERKLVHKEKLPFLHFISKCY